MRRDRTLQDEDGTPLGKVNEFVPLCEECEHKECAEHWVASDVDTEKIARSCEEFSFQN